MDGLVVTTDTGESFTLEKRNLEQGMRTIVAESNNAPPLVALSNATDLTLTHAEQLFQNGHHDAAQAFIKMGHVLHALGQKTAAFLSAAAHEAVAVTKKTVRERIKNPSAYLLEQVQHTVNSYKQATLLALQFGVFVTQDLETMVVRDLYAPGTVGSSDEMEHALRSYFNPIGILLNDVVNNLTPTQAGTLFGHLLGTVAVNKASKALFNKALSSVSKSAQTFANAMHDNAGKKLADQHGQKAVNKTINTLRKEPEKLSASKDVVKEVEQEVSRIASQELPVIGNKLRYLFGKATGSVHNIERSTSMLGQLESIGIFDNAIGNGYLEKHLKKIYHSAKGTLQSNGRFLRESFLIGPNGGLKMESIWEGNKLITVKLLGGRC